jgi:predicted KAP-like P-loop ATPase
VASRVEDKLNFWPVNLALSRFLCNRNTEPPLTVAITDSWSSGKSSLMNLLKEELVRSCLVWCYYFAAFIY